MYPIVNNKTKFLVIFVKRRMGDDRWKPGKVGDSTCLEERPAAS